MHASVLEAVSILALLLTACHDPLRGSADPSPPHGVMVVGDDVSPHAKLFHVYSLRDRQLEKIRTVELSNRCSLSFMAMRTFTASLDESSLWTSRCVTSTAGVVYAIERHALSSNNASQMEAVFRPNAEPIVVIDDISTPEGSFQWRAGLGPTVMLAHDGNLQFGTFRGVYLLQSNGTAVSLPPTKELEPFRVDFMVALPQGLLMTGKSIYGGAWWRVQYTQDESMKDMGNLPRYGYMDGAILDRRLYLLQQQHTNGGSRNVLDVYDIGLSKISLLRSWQEFGDRDISIRFVPGNEVLAGLQFTPWRAVASVGGRVVVAAGERGLLIFEDSEDPRLQAIGGDCLDVVADGDWLVALVRKEERTELVFFDARPALRKLVDKLRINMEGQVDELVAFHEGDATAHPPSN